MSGETNADVRGGQNWVKSAGPAWTSWLVADISPGPDARRLAGTGLVQPGNCSRCLSQLLAVPLKVRLSAIIAGAVKTKAHTKT